MRGSKFHFLKHHLGDFTYKYNKFTCTYKSIAKNSLLIHSSLAALTSSSNKFSITNYDSGNLIASWSNAETLSSNFAKKS